MPGSTDLEPQPGTEFRQALAQCRQASRAPPVFPLPADQPLRLPPFIEANQRWHDLDIQSVGQRQFAVIADLGYAGREAGIILRENQQLPVLIKRV